MRVVAWQNATKQSGGDCRSARVRPAMFATTALFTTQDLAPMTGTASHAAERSFGIHNHIERPWGPGGASPG
jgi:hypothetical protein